MLARSALSVAYPPMTRRRHKCESLRKNFHFDSFTAARPREGGKGGEPQCLSLSLSLSPRLGTVSHCVTRADARVARFSVVVVLSHDVTFSLSLSLKSVLFRRVSFLPKQSPTER